MALYKGQQKITPVKVVKKGGDYYVEQVNSDDGTCVLNITNADSVNKWKEYYIHMIQRDTDTLIIPEGVIKLGSSIFFNWNNDTVGFGKGLKNISLPNSLMNIETNAFYQCSQLLLEHLPKNLTQISTQAFRSCSKITIKNLPSNITILKSSAFLNCSSLTNMTFDGDITIIEASVFNNCTNLNKFLFPNNTAVPTLSNVNAIPNGASFTGQIAIPNTLYSSWTTASNWSSLTQAQWVRFINSWDEIITVEGDYALFNDTSLSDVRHLVPTAQTYNVTLHNYVTGAGENMLILNGNPTVEQNSEYVVTIEKTDLLEAPLNSSTFTPYITINGIELSNANYSTTTTTYRNNTYPTIITIKPNIINGDVDISLIYSESDDDPFDGDFI